MRRDIEVLKNTARNKTDQEKVKVAVAAAPSPPTATVAVSTVSAAVNTDSYDILEVCQFKFNP